MDGTSPGRALHISAQDVGSRVVLRYRLDPADHGQFGETLTDLVGELLEWDEGAAGRATVRRRSGEQVSVDLERIVAAKVIPSPRQKAAG